MRDFAPAAAASRRRIAETLLGVFERWGFARVITPAFEYEDVLALGLGGAGRAAAIRFVEPSSGQVVALRPDITPQIARLIATRFRDEAGAIRLCYEGTVVRLERGARGQRELIQAGVELAGVSSPHGDAEVIALGVAALAAAGLGAPTIDLGHLGLAREVLDALDLPDGEREEARLAIGKRDGSTLEAILRHARGPKPATAFAALLPSLSGPPSILADARKRAPTTGIKRALADLQAIVDAVAARNVGARVRVDLGEVRGFDYYTGVRVQGFVAGAPDAVLAGGRYDDLLGRYGRPSPAVGFAIDVEAAAGALDARAQEAERVGGAGAAAPANGNGAVLVVGPPAAAQRLADELRAQGKRAVAELSGLPEGELSAYAARWGFGSIVRAGDRAGANIKQGKRKR
ncbi:MAG TPA: ATP phosphoribosyltransferase regulatory subunit [Polyangia bacterium]|nr:ATP phosphoribosyltransferase regulatory subunit [Polyangia bacterium]